MKLKQFLLAISVLTYSTLSGQQLSKTLHAEAVLEVVRQFHPVVKQANISVDKSKAEILNARGNFDPVLNTYFAEKTFNGVNYYKDISPELKIPTWYGVDVYAGLDDLTGSRTDPSLTLGQSSYIGLNVPLVKNLVIDKRRAALLQAKIFNDMALAEQQLIINDLFMDAMEAYWLWVKAYSVYKVVESAVETSENRRQLVIKTYNNGECAAIDTTEALSQLQSFQYLKNERWLNFQNAGLMLSSFFWTSNNVPYQLDESVVPDSGWENKVIPAGFNLSLPDLLASADKNHPYIKIYNYKADVLGIEKKLKFQDLLPKVDFRYNFLAKGYEVQKTVIGSTPFRNNYQFGFKLETPLFFRQGRANYKIAKLKIEENKLDQNQQQRTLDLKIKSYFNEFIALKNQVELQSKNFINYQTLVKAEVIKYSNGESSLFLINNRESKALEAQEKLIDVKTKYFKSVYALQWSAGLLK